MKKINLSKRELFLILILAVAVLVYFYLNYLLFPSYNMANELRDELGQKKFIVVNKDIALKKMALIDSLLEDEKLQIEELEKKIPYTVKLPELVVNIDGKIKELGMDIKSISIGSIDQTNKEYDVIPIDVALKGNYDSILEFIKYIEDNERKYVVDSFALSPLRRAEPVSFSISMRTFMLKDSGSPMAPEPEDYPFFKHDNGKSYPFLENEIVPELPEDNIDEDIEMMEKKYEKLDDIVNGVEKIIPGNETNGEGN